MNDDLLLRMQKAGVNTRDGIERFGGRADLYIKYLKRFPTDCNFIESEKALADEDWSEFLSVVHTLKGVSANLGMDCLYAACSETVLLIRSERYQEAKNSYANIIDAYRRICNTLEGLEE